MNYHIIRTGESIQKIAYSYGLDIEEITKINQHISNWDRLIPGTKIKLPEISNQLMEELDEVEPFIEDYYPKINIPIKEDDYLIKEQIKEEKDLEEKTKVEESIKKEIKNKKYPINYPPYYNYPYPYGYYNFYNRRYQPPKKRSR